MGKFYYYHNPEPILNTYNVVAVGKSCNGDIVTIIKNIVAIGNYEARNHVDNLTDDIDDVFGTNLDWNIIIKLVD